MLSGQENSLTASVGFSHDLVAQFFQLLPQAHHVQTVVVGDEDS
jgi:hypothetical protein